MTNDIVTRQNLPQSLELLAAQKRVYSTAKTYLGLQALLSGPLAVLASVLGTYYANLRGGVATYAAAVAFLSVGFLEPKQKELKALGALIQEQFDSSVLSLSWNHFHAGKKADPEILARLGRVTEDVRPAILNWYSPAVSVLPLSVARFLCQRTNCWWDAHVRRQYVDLLTIAIAIAFLIGLVLGIANHMRFEDLILVYVMPALPLANWSLKERRDHTEAASISTRHKDYVEELWLKILDGAVGDAELEERSRALQDAILDRRRRSPLIFDWFYNLTRDKHHADVNRAIQVKVDEAIASFHRAGRMGSNESTPAS